MITKHRYEDGNKDQWLELRTSMDDKIGGSELGTIAGHNSYRSPFTAFCQKCEAIETPDISGKDAIIQGHDCEPVVADRFERETGKKVHVENCIYTNDKYPHLKASIDRKIAGERSGLECKTAKDMAMKKYKHGDFPMAYFDQCLLYLAVTEMERWYLAIMVFGTAFRMFMMTTIKAEAERYDELKKKYYGKGIVELGEDAESADYREWIEKWSKLEAVYYVDEEEMSACERLATLFIERWKAVKEFMEGLDPKEYNTEEKRKAALIGAVRQVWPVAEIDGSESSTETVAYLNPEVVVDSVQTLDESDPLMELVLHREEIDRQIKELEKAKSEIENQAAMKVGNLETVLLPSWKITYKMGTPRETGVCSAIRDYFAQRGEVVPEGLIKVGEAKRSLRFWTRTEKVKKSKTKAS